MSDDTGVETGTGTGAEDGSENGGGTPAGGGDNLSWRDLIKDEKVRKHAESYASLEDAVGNSLTLRQKLSNAITIPGEDATDEDWTDFRRKLGAPENVDGYEYVPPQLPAEVAAAIGEDGHSEFLALAHKVGLTKTQAKELLDFRYNELVAADESFAAELKRGREKREEELRRAWGSDYDRNVEIANRTVQTFGDDGLRDFLKTNVVDGVQLGNHPAVIEFLSKVGRGMMESNIPVAAGGEQRAALQEQYDSLTEKIHAAHRRGDTAETARLNKERAALTPLLYANGPIVGQEGRTV